MWLPEGAYRPEGVWTPPIPWGARGARAGLDEIIADEGGTHFFVESHVIEHGQSEWVNNGGWKKVGRDEACKYPGRGWRSIHEPVRVGGNGSAPGRTAAFARDEQVCKQVWSGFIGYPADGAYLEFHKKYGQRRGLRYWKVTDARLGLGDKAPYYPDDVAGKVHEHARHFCDKVKGRLLEHRRRTGRHGVVVACFDAELFGHWWFEGPRFLRDVMLNLNADSEVDLVTAEEFLRRRPPDKCVSLPEGSWGEGGDHRVWANEKVKWMWEIEYRCESLFGRLTYHLPWRQRPELRGLLEKAGRELLLLQASDWLFVVTRDQAVDYGIKRFMQHVSRFECLTDIVEKLASDSQYLGKLNEVEKFEIRDAEVHDIVFPSIDLNWWNT